MKRTFSRIAAFAGAILLTTFSRVSWSQAPAPDKTAPETPVTAPAHKHGLRKLLEHLHLTGDQRAKIKTIMSEHHSQARAIRENAVLSFDQKREQEKLLKKETRKQILETLTPDQRALLHELKRANKNDAAVTAPQR